MTNPPKVSIITVCYNSAKTIADTIDSVLSQDYPNIEYIIVDGKSKDNTVEIIQKYGARISRFISEPDKGIYDAMNKGLRMATGDVIGILNSDDFYIDSHVVSDLMQKMQSAGTDSVFADLVIVDPIDTTKVQRYYNSGSWNPRRLRFGWMPAHNTFFVKRQCYEKQGFYSLNYKIASDFDMMIRLLHVGGATYTHLSRPVIKMRAGGLSTNSLKSVLRLNREIVKACRSNGLWTTLPIVLLKMPAKLLETVSWRWRDLAR